MQFEWHLNESDRDRKTAEKIIIKRSEGKDISPSSMQLDRSFSISLSSRVSWRYAKGKKSHSA